MNKGSLKKYLLWFANEHKDFRINEIKSIATLLEIDLKWKEKNNEEPFVVVEVDSDEKVKKIVERSILLRCVIELWAESSEAQELHNNLKSLPSSFFSEYNHPSTSFKLEVEIFGNSQTQEQKVKKIELFNYLPLMGPVKLKNPDLSLQYIEYYGLDPKHIPSEPLHYFFGRIVGEGHRDLISKLSLKTRKFIGNTSMDPQLSLIMANQAHVKEGDIVLDPFVGTGSLLIAAAKFGGYVLGADIDFLMLHGRSRPSRKQDRYKPRNNESIYSNMVQYGVSDRYIDIVVADSSLPLWKPNLKLDSIITDPPYGIREAMERVGCTREDKTINEEHLKTHIPSKVQYSLKQLLADLMSFSAKHLKIGGRLVTWIPIIRCEYDENKLPHHESLVLVGNSEQILSTTSSRRLLTYSKINEPKSCEKMTIDVEEKTFKQKYQKYVNELKKTKLEMKYKSTQIFT